MKRQRKTLIVILCVLCFLAVSGIAAAQATMPGGWWLIQTKSGSNGQSGFWDLPGDGSFQKSSQLQLWSYTGNNASDRKFKFVHVGNGWYNIVCQYNNWCVDVTGGNSSNGTALVVYDNHGGRNQMFRFVDQGNGYYKIYDWNGKMLTAPGGQGAVDGAKLNIWDDHYNENGIWKLRAEYYVPVPPAPPAPVRQAPPPPSRQAPPPPTRQAPPPPRR